jgi:hypothetical protein
MLRRQFARTSAAVEMTLPLPYFTGEGSFESQTILSLIVVAIDIEDYHSS